MKVELDQQAGDHPRQRSERQVRVVGHRRAVSTEGKLRNDAPVAAAQPVDDVAPQRAVHQHSMQEDHRRPVTTGVGVHETSRRRSPEMHATPLAALERIGAGRPRRRSYGLADHSLITQLLIGSERQQ